LRKKRGRWRDPLAPFSFDTSDLTPGIHSGTVDDQEVSNSKALAAIYLWRKDIRFVTPK
jgi:hypothetical protein